jgi:hypothetical protein
MVRITLISRSCADSALGESSHTMGTSEYEHGSEPAGDAMDCPCGVKVSSLPPSGDVYDKPRPQESFPDAIRCDYCQKWYHIR